MSEMVPNPYSGLDQLIAKPTRAEAAPIAAQKAEEAEQDQSATTTPNGQAETLEKKSVHPAPAANLVCELEPNPPNTPNLYRKQTINFGPDDLGAVQKMQEALRNAYDLEVSKQDIVRASVEFLLKDHELHKENSYLVRKFVRR